MKDKKMLTISLGVALVLVFGVVIAYAALSSTLNATFNGVKQESLSWNVGFNTASGSTITGSSTGNSTGHACGSASVTSNGIVVGTTSVSKPGDSCSYSFRITNSGSVQAKVSSITAIKPNSTSCTTTSNSTTSTMVCGNVTYTFSGVTNNETLSTGSTKTGTLAFLAYSLLNSSFIITLTSFNPVKASFSVLLSIVGFLSSVL